MPGIALEDSVRRKLLKTLSVVLGAAVSSMAWAQEPGETPCEYGVMPYEPPVYNTPDYGIEEPPAVLGVPVWGVVRQAGTEAPLQGIQVTHGAKQGITGADGRFEFISPISSAGELELTFEAADIDGAKHGGDHEPATVSVKVVDGVLPREVSQQGLVLEMAKKK